ncbi:MAG: transposase [Bacteroidota bacterium]
MIKRRKPGSSKKTFATSTLTHPKKTLLLSFSQWSRNAQRCGLGHLIKVADMFDRHMQGIVNAMAERINGKLQEIKMTARGHRSLENFKSAILFSHGDLTYTHTKLSRT